jgi:hypothetical protein
MLQTARAPSYMKQFLIHELSSLKVAHGPISNRYASERSSIKKKRERHCHPTARAPLMKGTNYDLTTSTGTTRQSSRKNCM